MTKTELMIGILKIVDLGCSCGVLQKLGSLEDVYVIDF